VSLAQRSRLGLVGLTAGLLCACATTIAPPPPDTTTIVGRWSGSWWNQYNKSSLEFTVTQVDGERVTGLAFLRGFMPYHYRDLPFTGVLSGARLTGSMPTGPGAPPIYWDLTLSPDGRSLSGKGYRDIWSNIELSR
jgi:hypothetical protein